MYVDGVEVEREAREDDRRKEKRDNAVPGNAKQENVEKGRYQESDAKEKPGGID